jgi:hypothetical protein
MGFEGIRQRMDEFSLHDQASGKQRKRSGQWNCRKHTPRRRLLERDTLAAPADAHKQEARSSLIAKTGF